VLAPAKVVRFMTHGTIVVVFSYKLGAGVFLANRRQSSSSLTQMTGCALRCGHCDIGCGRCVYDNTSNCRAQATPTGSTCLRSLPHDSGSPAPLGAFATCCSSTVHPLTPRYLPSSCFKGSALNAFLILNPTFQSRRTAHQKVRLGQNVAGARSGKPPVCARLKGSDFTCTLQLLVQGGCSS
jgi:hypothetical protein